MLTATKIYRDIPFAHRQHTHQGHCRLIHGHNWQFEFTFAANKTDENGFVMDFGKLAWLKKWIDDHFDHTLVLNEDDPDKKFLFRSLQGLTDDQRGLAKITFVPDASCEGLARWLLEECNILLNQGGLAVDRNVRIVSVTVREDSKNSATYSVSTCGHE